MNYEVQAARALLEGSDAYIFTKDLQGHYTYANKKVCELFGLSLKEIIGKSDENFFSLEQSNDLRENDLSVIETGMSLIKEERNVISSTGEARFYMSEKKPLLDSDGLIIGVFGISTDVTDEKRLSKELAKSDSRFKTIFQEAPLGIALIDSITGKIYDANPAYQKIAGRSLAELKILDWMEITHPDDIQKDLDNMARVKIGEISCYSMHKRFIDKSGLTHWVKKTVAKLEVTDTEKPMHVCMTEDIHDQKVTQEKLFQLAHHDELTGLPNRTFFADRFKLALANSKRTKAMFGICVIDVDDFKPINDNFGHQVGDKILIEIASRIKNTIRVVDTAARIGGDEFTVLITDFVFQAEFEQLLGRILTALKEPYVIGDYAHKISASIGATVYPMDRSDLDELMQHADQAMYAAKRTGKNKYIFFQK